jgi:hypothetical protein
VVISKPRLLTASPFGPPIPPQPRVYSRNRPLVPSSAPRSVNISPVRAIFLATRHSTLATSHCPTPRFPRFHRLTNPSSTIDLQPSRYQQITNPAFRNPFVFSSIQNPRGCGGAHFHFSTLWLCVSVANPMFSAVCGLFVVSLRSFLHSFPLFSTGCRLFSQNTRGGIQLQLPRQKTKGHAGACPLHNSNQLRVNYAPAPLEKLPTASASVLYTSKTVRSLVICRTS